MENLIFITINSVLLGLIAMLALFDRARLWLHLFLAFQAAVLIAINALMLLEKIGQA